MHAGRDPEQGDQETPASFEPTLDYVVVKIPRWPFDKFSHGRHAPHHADEVHRRGHGHRPHLRGGPAEGAALAGHQRVLGLRRLVQGRDGRAAPATRRTSACSSSTRRSRPGRSPWRRSPSSSNIDPWFLIKIKNIVDMAEKLKTCDPRPREPAQGEAHGLHRRVDRRAARASRRRRSATRAGRSGVIPTYKMVDTCAAEFDGRDALLLLHLRGRVRAAALGPEEGPDHRLRAHPHRPGHRVRLLHRARGPGAAGGGHRGAHHQQQPGDGLHRLRHLRQAVLRAADARGRDEHHREGAPLRRHGPVRRPDVHQPGHPAADGAHPPQGPGHGDHRHQPGRHEHGRGPGPVEPHDEGDEHPPAGQRHRLLAGRGQGRRQPDRLSRSWCAHPTCWAAGRWRSSTTRPTSSGT